MDQSARGIQRLGEDKVSKRDDARVTKCTKQLRQTYQELSNKIDMKIRSLTEMHAELTSLNSIIGKCSSESEHTERVFKEVSRPARADKTLLEERRERLKLSHSELKRSERVLKENGEKTVLRVLNRCGDENGRQIRERLATCERTVEHTMERVEKEDRKLSKMISLLGDFEVQAEYLENEIQNHQNLKGAESKLAQLRESASYLLDSGNFSDHSPVTLRLDRINRMLTSAAEQNRARQHQLEKEKEREAERDNQFELLKNEINSLEVIQISKLSSLPQILRDLDSQISTWENLEPKLEYLESLNETKSSEPMGSLRRRSRKHRTSTLPRNVRSSSASSGVLGVEGLRLKYESIGDRIISTRNYGQILLEQMEIWQSSFFKATNLIKDLRLNGSNALINATSEVGEAVRAGNAVIQTSKTKLDHEPSDLGLIVSEIDKLKTDFNAAQKYIFENKQSEDNEHKKKQLFRSKLEAISSWLQDQWNLISHLGKISADPVVLEQQMIQESDRKKRGIG